MSEVTENLYESMDIDLLRGMSQEQRELGNRFMLKLAFAALIIAPNGDVLVAGHEAKDGEFEQGALGTLMETYRYVPHVQKNRSEQPIAIFHRALHEEFGLDEDTYSKAGFYFDRKNPLSHGEWSGGPRDGFADFYAWTTSLFVRVTNPEVITFDHRLGEEILWTEFRAIDAVLNTKEPIRPGFLEWMARMQRQLSLPVDTSIVHEVPWTESIVTGKDIRYPFEEAA